MHMLLILTTQKGSSTRNPMKETGRCRNGDLYSRFLAPEHDQQHVSIMIVAHIFFVPTVSTIIAVTTITVIIGNTTSMTDSDRKAPSHGFWSTSGSLMCLYTVVWLPPYAVCFIRIRLEASRSYGQGLLRT